MKAKRYAALALAGFVLWIVETALFGWNKVPGSAAEAIMDSLAFWFMFWGTVGNLLSNVVVNKSYNPQNTYIYKDETKPERKD